MTDRFPKHYRWSCRRSIMAVLWSLREPIELERSAYFIGAAETAALTMSHLHDPLANRYWRRVQRLKTLHAQAGGIWNIPN